MDLTDLTADIDVQSINQNADYEIIESSENLITQSEPAKRALDSDDILEIQQSKLNDIHNNGVYTIDTDENIGTFTFRIQRSSLERTVERRRNNDNFPDTVSPEYIISREIEWILTTLSNGQRLKKHLDIGYGQYYASLQLSEDKITVTLVYDPDY